MTKENNFSLHVEGEPVPIMVCLQCVESGYQIDPRVRTPNYPVIVTTCRIHQICNGEYDATLGLEKEVTESEENKTNE